MKKWNTEVISKTISKVAGVEKINIGPVGSEMTTEQLICRVKGSKDKLYVRGFNTGEPLNKANDVEVEMVELTSEYSDGGESSSPTNILARAKITIALNKLGYSVVRSLDSYF